MDFSKVSHVNKQILLRLSLGLFTEYRSAKIRKNGNIVFWNFKRSVFNTRNVMSFTDLVFKHIPLQLSYCKWRNHDKYSHYLDTLDEIFNNSLPENEKITAFNMWFIHEFNGVISINLSSPTLEERRVKINQLSLKSKKGRKNYFKIGSKADLLDPYIERIRNFDSKKFVQVAKLTLQTAVIATLIRLNVAFMPLVEKEIEFPVYLKKDYFTEQPLVQAPKTREISIVDINNHTTNKKEIIFDSS